MIPTASRRLCRRPRASAAAAERHRAAGRLAAAACSRPPQSRRPWPQALGWADARSRSRRCWTSPGRPVWRPRPPARPPCCRRRRRSCAFSKTGEAMQDPLLAADAAASRRATPHARALPPAPFATTAPQAARVASLVRALAAAPLQLGGPLAQLALAGRPAGAPWASPNLWPSPPSPPALSSAPSATSTPTRPRPAPRLAGPVASCRPIGPASQPVCRTCWTPSLNADARHRCGLLHEPTPHPALPLTWPSRRLPASRPAAFNAARHHHRWPWPAACSSPGALPRVAELRLPPRHAGLEPCPRCLDQPATPAWLRTNCRSPCARRSSNAW